MTDKNESLNSNPCRHGIYSHRVCEICVETAALEEKHQARIAMLVSALETILSMDVKGHELQDRLQFSTAGRAIYEQVALALSTTQQDADAFVARVEADKARLEWLEKLFTYNWNGVVDSGSRTYWTIPSSWRHTVQLMEGFTFREAIDNAIAAEKRNSSAQPEGKKV